MADHDQHTKPQEKRAERDEHKIEDLDVLDKDASEVKGGVSLNYTSVQQTYKSQ
jgi:hypothetical protein